MFKKEVPPADAGDSSPEEIAYKLMRHIAVAERKSLHTNVTPGYVPANRKWILDTYAECIKAVRGQRDFTSPSVAPTSSVEAEIY